MVEWGACGPSCTQALGTALVGCHAGWGGGGSSRGVAVAGSYTYHIRALCLLELVPFRDFEAHHDVAALRRATVPSAHTYIRRRMMR